MKPSDRGYLEFLNGVKIELHKLGWSVSLEYPGHLSFLCPNKDELTMGFTEEGSLFEIQVNSEGVGKTAKLISHSLHDPATLANEINKSLVFMMEVDYQYLFLAPKSVWLVYASVKVQANNAEEASQKAVEKYAAVKDLEIFTDMSNHWYKPECLDEKTDIPF